MVRLYCNVCAQPIPEDRMKKLSRVCSPECGKQLKVIKRALRRASGRCDRCGRKLLKQSQEGTSGSCRRVLEEVTA